MTREPINYHAVQSALADVRAPMDAAEAQGMLCGMLTASLHVDAAQWIARVLDGTEPRGEPAHRVLEQLALTFQETRQGLEDSNLQFDLLLPGDDEPLSNRAEALGAWCSGFLFGVGSESAPAEALVAGEGREALAGLAEIARVDSEAAEGSDEDAYAELVEFVRVAALMVREQVQPARRRAPVDTSSPAGSDRLH